MRVKVEMPQLGESIVEGTIVEWLKQVGDLVEADEEIFTLVTDKVDAAVPSPAAGVLAQIDYAAGDVVEVNTTVAWIETDAAAYAAGTADVGEPVELAQAGNQEIIAAPADPVVVVGPSATDAPTVGEAVEDLRRRRSTPLVRKLAQEHGVKDLSAIPGTGVSGRVTRDDLLKYVADGKTTAVSTPPPPVAPKAATPPPPAAPKASAKKPASGEAITAPTGYDPAFVKRHRIHIYDNDRVEPMSRMRGAIAENMLQARRSTAHCHTVWEADVTNLIKARNALRRSYEERGVKLAYTAFFVAAVTRTLQDWPLLNAAVDGDQIVFRGNFNVGVATSIEDGLIVPVIKGADGMNLFGVARSIADLAERARANKLVPADVADGTFTISNAGIWGSLFGIPILVTPQVGILGIGGVQKRVVADENDNIRIRSIVTMCLTFDHRIIDGATADGFMRDLTKRIATWKGEG